MNISFIVYLIIICLIIWIIYRISKCFINCRFHSGHLECFSNVENKKIGDIFDDAQRKNETYGDIRDTIKKEGIQFGKASDQMDFKQYYEMYLNYNKGTLRPGIIDQIRNK